MLLKGPVFVLFKMGGVQFSGHATGIAGRIKCYLDGGCAGFILGFGFHFFFFFFFFLVVKFHLGVFCCVCLPALFPCCSTGWHWQHPLDESLWYLRTLPTSAQQPVLLKFCSASALLILGLPLNHDITLSWVEECSVIASVDFISLLHYTLLLSLKLLVLFCCWSYCFGFVPCCLWIVTWCVQSRCEHGTSPFCFRFVSDVKFLSLDSGLLFGTFIAKTSVSYRFDHVPACLVMWRTPSKYISGKWICLFAVCCCFVALLLCCFVALFLSLFCFDFLQLVSDYNIFWFEHEFNTKQSPKTRMGSAFGLQRRREVIFLNTCLLSSSLPRQAPKQNLSHSSKCISSCK